MVDAAGRSAPSASHRQPTRPGAAGPRPERTRTALVTGASRGIGAAVADRLRADGFDVSTAERATGFDLGDPAEARRAAAQSDRLDAVVANHGTIVRGPAEDFALEDWQRIVDVNLTSVFALVQAAAARMPDGGSIVLLASQTSFSGGFHTAAYSASKGGVAQLAKSLSNEWASRGIRVNAVAPGWVETEMTSTLSPERRAEITARIPIGRWARPEEIAEAVAWLVSPASAYVTGVILPVDGGYLAR
jgi:2-deoxy-D-gluconate 3-dehydrogenase